MEKYRKYSRAELLSFSKKAEIEEDVSLLENGNSLDVANFVRDNNRELSEAGIEIRNLLFTEIYWLCRHLYKVKIVGDEAPDVECFIPKLVDHFMVALDQYYNEEIDDEQMIGIDRELEQEFGVRREGSFIWGEE